MPPMPRGWVEPLSMPAHPSISLITARNVGAGGDARHALSAFIDGIPDWKLTALPVEQDTKIHEDENFQLVLLGITSYGTEYNLQVQVNAGATLWSLKIHREGAAATGTSVARQDIDSDAMGRQSVYPPRVSVGSWSPGDIRDDLKRKIMI
ncbi:hypothetical protein MKEN_01391000 [Mycena kentingensis (nom. inval.)]|nr:hypothetical protein MKEN_01391000 [Mycena kentingensis (nom. inval.)]